MKACGPSLLIALSLLSSAATAMPKSGPVDGVTKAGRTGWIVDINETRLAISGGYGGARVRTAELTKWRNLDGVTIYRAAGRDGHYYADRDGDGRIDAGVVYVPATGMVLIDWNCDGRGDRILTDLSPPDPRVSLRTRLERQVAQHSVRLHQD